MSRGKKEIIRVPQSLLSHLLNLSYVFLATWEKREHDVLVHQLTNTRVVLHETLEHAISSGNCHLGIINSHLEGKLYIEAVKQYASNSQKVRGYIRISTYNLNNFIKNITNVLADAELHFHCCTQKSITRHDGSTIFIQPIWIGINTNFAFYHEKQYISNTKKQGLT